MIAMNNRLEYNEFLAVHVLNKEDCVSELNSYYGKPEMLNALSGILALMEKKHPFNIWGNDYDPYFVKKETLHNLRNVLRLNRTSLSEEEIKVLDAIELNIINGYMQPLNMPKLPPESSFYYGQPLISLNPQTARDTENIYAFFEVNEIDYDDRDVISQHADRNRRREVPNPKPFTQAIEQNDLLDVVTAISYQQFKVGTHWINQILNTPSCFTANVSKEAFAKALDASRRGVSCAGYYAAFAIISHAYTTEDMTTEEAGPRINQLHDLMYGMGDSDLYAFSGSVFKLGLFAQAPLTPEEIRAVPFAFGFWSGVSEIVPHDDAKHIPALVDKLALAGFTMESDFLKKKILSTPVVQKIRRKAKN